MSSFRSRYGPWALVAGASEGLGAEFAKEIARRGVNVILVARREEALARTAAAIAGVEVRTLVLDLAAADAAGAVREAARDVDLGLLVYNAAFSPIGPFLDRPVEDHLRELVGGALLVGILDAEEEGGVGLAAEAAHVLH